MDEVAAAGRPRCRRALTYSQGVARVVFVLVVAALAVTASSGAAPAARAHVVVLETGWKTTTTDGQPQALGYGWS